ncbi:MAG: glycogen/starch synthase [Alistipes sp.]|nr:glycogen/starch synthase [Candidatus Minthomonas equi]
MAVREPKRVLFVDSEILPYLPETKISMIGRYLPQFTQEGGKEFRSFMPRYGCINERRNQLHEVIRLSGMNIVIDDIDRPLIIKVSSIPSARMQVYFIDNEDYFKRKQVFFDTDGVFMADNVERAAFFARGVLETVKKLRWKPDVIHCNGWISHIIPLYLKKVYKNDPLFSSSKVVVSLYDDDCLQEHFSSDMKSKVMMTGIRSRDIEHICVDEPLGINLAKLAVQYSDGVIMGSAEIEESLSGYVAKLGLPVLPYVAVDTGTNVYAKKYNGFYDQILQKGSDAKKSARKDVRKDVK